MLNVYVLSVFMLSVVSQIVMALVFEIQSEVTLTPISTTRATFSRSVEF